MRENEPVLLVLPVYDGKLFLRRVKFYRLMKPVSFFDLTQSILRISEPA